MRSLEWRLLSKSVLTPSCESRSNRRRASLQRYKLLLPGEYPLDRVASGRISTYLGDWHTHPLGSEQLSPIDIAALKEIASSEEARCSQPLMLLAVGGPKFRLHLWQWSSGCQTRARPVELHIA